MNWKIQYYEDWSSSFGVLTQLVCTSNPVFFICVNFWQICLKILKIVSWFPEKQSRCFEPALSVFRGDNLPWNIQLAEKRWYMNPWDSYWDIFFFSSTLPPKTAPVLFFLVMLLPPRILTLPETCYRI